MSEKFTPNIHIDLDIEIKAIKHPNLTQEKLDALIKTWLWHSFDELMNESFLQWYELEDMGITDIYDTDKVFDYKYTSTYPEK